MQNAPTVRLDPKIKTAWRISDAIVLSVILLFFLVPGLVIFLSEPKLAFYAELYCAICLAIYVMALIGFLFVITPIRYIRWRYELSPDYLDIEHGVIWRKHCIIPFIRVQNTDTRQGPILRSLGLASVTVSTAAGSHVIPGLITDVADEVRDRAAEYARLAKEDV